MDNKITFTDASCWLVPMYRIAIKELKDTGFIDAYIADETRPREDLCTLLLFRASEEAAMILEDIQMYLDKYVVDMYGHQGKLVVLVLKIPEEFEGDYELILQGEFSNLSPDYRELVSEKVPITNEGTFKTNGKRLQLLIMDKSPMVKRLAVSTIESMEDVADGQIWHKLDKKKNTITVNLINKIIDAD